jgi:hypothetical protein
MLAVLRLAILNWWKRRCTSYIHVTEEKHDLSPNQDYRIGVMQLYADGTDPREDFSFNVSSEDTRSYDSSSSVTSASHFDVSSITSSQEGQNDMLISACASDDDIMDCQWIPPPQKIRRQYSTGDIQLTAPYALTPSRSLSINSIVSIDSLDASKCWDSADGVNDNVVADLCVYAQESFRFLSSTTSTTDDTQTISDCDHNQYFFIQHMKFLRNQTRPQRFREHSHISR